MSVTDHGYLEERERERQLDFPLCRCSSCDPQGAARIIRLLPQTSISHLDELLRSESNEFEDTSVFQLPKKTRNRMVLSNMPQLCKRDDPIRVNPMMIELAVALVGHTERLYAEIYPNGCELDASELFTREEVWSIVKNHAAVVKGNFFELILGGEVLPGLFEMITWVISIWYKSDIYTHYQQALEDKQVELEQGILNEKILEAERIEKVRLKAEQKELKNIQIQASKRLRQEKAEQRENKRKAKEDLQRGRSDLIRSSIQ